MSERRFFFLVDLALLTLLAATYGLSFLQLGVFSPVLHLGIAATMAALVAWYLMHLRSAKGIVRLFARRCVVLALHPLRARSERLVHPLMEDDLSRNQFITEQM